MRRAVVPDQTSAADDGRPLDGKCGVVGPVMSGLSRVTRSGLESVEFRSKRSSLAGSEEMTK